MIQGGQGSVGVCPVAEATAEIISGSQRDDRQNGFGVRDPSRDFGNGPVAATCDHDLRSKANRFPSQRGPVPSLPCGQNPGVVKPPRNSGPFCFGGASP